MWQGVQNRLSSGNIAEPERAFTATLDSWPNEVSVLAGQKPKCAKALFTRRHHIWLQPRISSDQADELSNSDRTGKPQSHTLSFSAVLERMPMKKHYLQLSVSRCNKCHGPVVTGSVAARENEISKEIEKQEIGAICLSCGYQQSATLEAAPIRHFPPMEWAPAGEIDPRGI
jgi:hypothetical protein